MASREDLEKCGAGDTHACYRAIRDEGRAAEEKLKEMDKEDKESGVSSGDSYLNSCSRDRYRSDRPSYRSSTRDELGIGSLVITRKPIDPTCIGFTYCYKYFRSTSGLFVYIFNQAGLSMATFLTVPHEYKIFFDVHDVVFRYHIIFKDVVARNLTYQQLVDSMFSGVGQLIDQSLVG